MMPQTSPIYKGDWRRECLEMFFNLNKTRSSVVRKGKKKEDDSS
jgi:hypothetical protein